MTDSVVTTWVHVDDEAIASTYHQVGRDSAALGFQDVYWRSAALFFACSRRHNPDIRHILFTNQQPKSVEGYDIAAFLRRLDVEIQLVSLNHIPPDGYHGAWRNQFYVLDILEALNRMRLRRAVLLDADCLFVNSVARLFEVIDRYKVATYVVEDIAAKPAYVSNGLAAADRAQLARELSGDGAADYPYCGGEIIAATGSGISKLCETYPAVWRESLVRHERGQLKFNEEAQLLSYLYGRLGYEFGTANDVIRRIWTARRYRNAGPRDMALDIWHLPAEKKYGFDPLFRDVMRLGSDFWTTPIGVEFRSYVGKYVGVPRPSPRKWMVDMCKAAVEKLRR